MAHKVKDKDKLQTPGARPHKPQLPHGWMVRVSRTYPDRVYYFNKLTGATSWELPGLVEPDAQQSTEGLKGSKENSSQKKHRQRRNSDQTHHRKHHRRQKLPQKADPDNGGDTDEDWLDLNCEDPPERSSDLCSLITSNSESCEKTSGSEGDKNISPAKQKQRERKEKWKTLWDSHLNLTKQREATAQNENEQLDTDLSPEELNIIRFPKCKKVDTVTCLNSATTSGEKVTATTASTSQSLVPQVTSTPGASGSNSAGTDMGNFMPSNASSPGESIPGMTTNAYIRARSRSPLSGAARSPCLLPTLNQTVVNTDLSVSNQSSRRPGETGVSSPLRSNSKVTVEYRAGLKTGGSETPVSRPCQQTHTHRQSSEATVKRNSAPSDVVVEFRQGFRPVSPQREAGLREGMVLPNTKVSPNIIHPVPFTPRVIAGNFTVADAVARAHVKAANASAKKAERTTIPSGGRRESVHAQKPATASESSGEVSKQRKRKLKRLPLDRDSSTSATAHETVSSVSAEPGAPASQRLSGGAGERSATSGQQSPVSSQQEGENTGRGRSRRKREKRKKSGKNPVDTGSAESGAVSPHSSPCSALSPDSHPGTSSHRIQTAKSPQTTAWRDLSRGNHAEMGLTGHGFPSSSAFSILNSSGSSALKQRTPGEVRVSSAFTTPHPHVAPHLWSHSPDSLATSSSRFPQVGLGVNEPGSAFPFSSVVAVGTGVGDDGHVDMEVDDDGDQIMLQELRESFKPDMNMKAVGMLTESIQQKQTDRPFSPFSDLIASSQLVYVVVDTNVLINSLKFVQNLRDMALKDYGRPYLVIPWVVLQELDAMKGSRLKKMSHEKKAQDAVRYLHSCFVSHHPRVRGQTPAEACELIEKLPIQCNDDRILQCCLQCQKKYGEPSVMLLTDDLNLENKAVVMGIKCFSTKTLRPLLTEVVVECDSPSPMEDASKSPGDRPGPFQRQHEPARSTPQSVNTQQVKKQEVRQSGQGSATSASHQQLRQQRIAMDELMCGVNSVLKSALPPLVEAEMKEAYGHLWTDVVYRKPPWSSYDLALILQKHWIAVFSLKMDRQLNTQVEQLAQHLRPETATQLEVEEMQKLLNNSLRLVKAVHELRSCSTAVRQLEKLVEKGRRLQPSTKDGVRTPSSDSDHTKSADGKRKKSQPSSSTHKPSDRPSSAASSSSSSALSSTSSSLTLHGSRRVSTEMTEGASERREQQRQDRERTSSEPGSSSQAKQHRTPVLNDSTNQTDRQVERRMSTEQTKDGPSVKKGRRGSVETTLGSPTFSSDNNNSRMKSPAAAPTSSQIQIPKTITPEEAAAIGDLFQAIWSAIFDFCNNMQTILASQATHTEITSFAETLSLLVPLVPQIRNEFAKCLSFSPLNLENHVDNFFLFCSCLNNFFVHSKIPSPPLTPVAPGNMITFMADTKNRVTLFNGLRQLDDMVLQLHSLISRLPD